MEQTLNLLQWPNHSHDPGGRKRLPVDPHVVSQAQFSSCGRYRPLLTRIWDPLLPLVLFVGMNPSSADLTVDDPTVRKECGYARRWLFGGLIKCNVMDYRATNPKTLLDPTVVPCSAENLSVIAAQLSKVQHVVAAWGRLPPSLKHHANTVSALLDSFRGDVWCLGVNQDLSPKHPLYLRNSAPRVPYCWKGNINES